MVYVYYWGFNSGRKLKHPWQTTKHPWSPFCTMYFEWLYTALYKTHVHGLSKEINLEITPKWKRCKTLWENPPYAHSVSYLLHLFVYFLKPLEKHIYCFPIYAAKDSLKIFEKSWEITWILFAIFEVCCLLG